MDGLSFLEEEGNGGLKDKDETKANHDVWSEDL